MRLTISLRAALLAAAACSPALLATPVLAQSKPPAPAKSAPAASATAPTAPVDPVVAKVNGQDITMSDLQDIAQEMPPQMRNLPQATVLGMLTDQLIDRKTTAIAAVAAGLDKDPAVVRQLARLRESVLENALLAKEVGPSITEDAINTRYLRDYANKPGELEVHARHILVPTEDAAKKIIADLKAGGDFMAIAKAQSADPGSAKDGGDLGFFKRGDMVPEFAEVAFTLKPGQISDKPVKTQFGWHVIKVEEIRQAPAQSYQAVHDTIRDAIISEDVRALLTKLRTTVKVERFNPSGGPASPLDSATPPPAR